MRPPISHNSALTAPSNSSSDPHSFEEAQSSSNSNLIPTSNIPIQLQKPTDGIRRSPHDGQQGWKSQDGQAQTTGQDHWQDHSTGSSQNTRQAQTTEQKRVPNQGQATSQHQRHALAKKRGRMGRSTSGPSNSPVPVKDNPWNPPVTSTSGRMFLFGWVFILLGYGVIGRGFANLGFAPVYVGEVVLSIGVLAMMRSGALGKLFKYPISKILLAFVIWSLLMTLPQIPKYGVFALRDGVLWGYSIFGLVVASIMVSSPPVFRWILLRYRAFSVVFLAVAWLMFVIMTSEVAKGFKLPGSSVDFFESKGGDLLVHLSGIAAFIAVGMSRQRWVFVPLLLFNLAILLISKRAGMLAFGAAFILLLVLNPPKMKLSAIVFSCLLSISAVLLINPKIDLGHGRIISAEQLTENVVSTFDNSASSTLETTKSWRLNWWSDIISYTFGGRYFLFGKGYGINLATDDGYQVLGDDALRSPHNAHMNILARSGVIGFGLWLAVHLTWFISLLKACLQARRRSMPNWHGIFAFLLAYWLAFMVNASFDVFLEGPMGGVWLWSVIGFGIGALHLYKTQPTMGLDHVPVVIRRHVVHSAGASE